MRIPVHTRQYRRTPDGRVELVKVEGWSPFMFIDSQMLRSAKKKPDAKGRFNLHNETFRVLFCRPSLSAYYDEALVMKDSLIAGALRWWYQNLPGLIDKVYKFERESLICKGFSEGEQLPRHSLTGLLLRTYIDA